MSKTYNPADYDVDMNYAGNANALASGYLRMA